MTELELQLQAKKAEPHHAQRLVDAAQQDADPQHAHEVHTFAVLPDLLPSQHEATAACAAGSKAQISALKDSFKHLLKA